MEQGQPYDGALARVNDDTTTTPSTVFDMVLRESGVDSRLLAVLTDMPLLRVVDAFACARCASDGPTACLDDLDHRNRRTNQKASRPSPGYDDHSLLGQCICALVPGEAIAAAVDVAVWSGRDVNRQCARAHNDGDVDVQHELISRPTLRLCIPTERDTTRLAAWMWTEAISADHSASWKSACRASAQCWHAVAQPHSFPGEAPVLGIRTVDGACCLSHHSFKATWLAANLERCQKFHARGEVERTRHPCDARIFAFSKHRSLGSLGCYTYIDGDPLFVIIADW